MDRCRRWVGALWGWAGLRTLAMSLALWLMLPAGGAVAQDIVPTAETLLPQLVAYAREYREKLPSLLCDEAITSQTLKKGVVHKEMRIEATLRETRDASGPGPFLELRRFLSVDGHPAPSKFGIPFFVQGGFANALGFNDPRSVACFDSQISVVDAGRTIKLELKLKPGIRMAPCDDLPAGFRRLVVLDRASGRVISMERTFPPGSAKYRKEVYFASMEYGPQKIGDETLWLPTRMTAHNEKDDGRMVIVYSNYHRYVASSTIVPVDGH